MEEEEKRLAEELLGAGPKGSFVKALFGGEEVHIPPYPAKEPDDVSKYVSLIKEFALENIDADKIDREARVPDSVIKGLGKLGVLGMTIGKEWGGLGVSQYTYCKVMQELAAVCASTAILVNAHQSIGLKSLLLFGSPEQKKEWLPKLAKGEALAAFSLTEPNAGSDAAGVETRAELENGVWTINGEKQWTTNGSIADLLTVMAKTKCPDGQERVTAFIVSPRAKGIKILDKAQEKVGIRGTRTTNYRLENVKVKDSERLGAVGGGLRICLTALDFGRVTFGATCTGIAKDLLERVKTYGLQRKQFKKPLVHFELIKKKVAYIAAATYAMDAATYYTAAMIDRGQEDIMLEAAILKVFASEALWKIVYEAMQIYGGRSFFTNEPLERIMRDARLNMIGEGANEVLRVFIAAVGFREVGNKIKGLLDKKDVLGALPHIKAIWAAPKLPFHSSYNHEIEKRIRTFRRNVYKLIVKYREGIVERQLELNRMTDGVIALYTMIAVLARLEVDPKEKEVADYFCQLALKSFDQAMKLIGSKEDAALVSLSDNITGYKV